MLNQFAHVADTVNEGVVDHMTDSNHWLGDGGFTVFWMIVMVAVVVLVIFLIVRGTFESTSGKDPLDVVKTRYAKGEINKKEYEHLKKELSK